MLGDEREFGVTMATATKAISEIAKASGISLAKVIHAARALREADGDFWPQGARGRGREAHVAPHYLVNLLLALAAAEPITDAPRVVVAWRQLVALTPRFTQENIQTRERSTASSSQATLAPKLQSYGTTLGTQLDGLVTAVEEDRSLWEKFRKRPDLALKLSLHGAPNARIISSLPIDKFGTDCVEEMFYQTQRETEQPLIGPFQREVTITFGLLDVLFELWAETQSHRAIRHLHQNA